MHKNNCQNHTHQPPLYEKYLPRLNRSIGQLEGIKKMIQGNRYCPEIILQLHAVRAAIKSLTIQMLNAHMATCVKEAFEYADKNEQEKKIAEIQNLIKKFE